MERHLIAHSGTNSHAGETDLFLMIHKPAIQLKLNKNKTRMSVPQFIFHKTPIMS